MNQISLYNKSTDSKLSIEAEELTRSRNIKIPKDGSFLLTNKTRLTENLATKYTVGPTGDFQELEEAVRVLCNMKQYENWKKPSKIVTLELQPNYIFKSYVQSSMDATFIYVTSNTPITINVDDGTKIDPYSMSIFTVSNGGKSPKFHNITFNITAVDTRLLWVGSRSFLSIENCTFNIDYRDNARLLNNTFASVELNGLLRLSSVVFNIEKNKNNELLLNNGSTYIHNLFAADTFSGLICLNSKFNIKDYSNRNDGMVERVFSINCSSIAVFSSTSVINYESEHGRTELFIISNHGELTAIGGVTVTVNSKSSYAGSIIWYGYNRGVINCERTVLLNCGTQDKPMKYAFSSYNDSRLVISNYKNTNSFFTSTTNIPVNTLNKDGVISQ